MRGLDFSAILFEFENFPLKHFPPFRWMLKLSAIPLFKSVYHVKKNKKKQTWQRRHKSPVHLLVVHYSCSNAEPSPVGLVYLLLSMLNPRRQNRSGPTRTEYTPQPNLTGSLSPYTTKMESETLNKSEDNFKEQNLLWKFWQNHVVMIDYENDFNISVSWVNFQTGKRGLIC